MAELENNEAKREPSGDAGAAGSAALEASNKLLADAQNESNNSSNGRSGSDSSNSSNLPIERNNPAANAALPGLELFEGKAGGAPGADPRARSGEAAGGAAAKDTADPQADSAHDSDEQGSNKAKTEDQGPQRNPERGKPAQDDSQGPNSGTTDQPPGEQDATKKTEAAPLGTPQEVARQLHDDPTSFDRELRTKLDGMDPKQAKEYVEKLNEELKRNNSPWRVYRQPDGTHRAYPSRGREAHSYPRRNY